MKEVWYADQRICTSSANNEWENILTRTRFQSTDYIIVGKGFQVGLLCLVGYWNIRIVALTGATRVINYSAIASDSALDRILLLFWRCPMLWIILAFRQSLAKWTWYFLFEQRRRFPAWKICKRSTSAMVEFDIFANKTKFPWLVEIQIASLARSRNAPRRVCLGIYLVTSKQ